MKTLTILSTILILSSCAIHSGTITSNVTDEPVVHVDMAIGVATTNIVFGIGGLSKDALISRARKNMVLSRPLQGEEQYNNVEVNVKNTYYIIGRSTKVTVQADVIEPKDSINQPSYSEEYLNQLQMRDTDISFFAVGDSVYVNNLQYPVARIVRIHGDDSGNRIEVNYMVGSELKVAKVSPQRLFLVKPEHFGMKLGERYENGVILGFGIKRILIKTMLGMEVTNYPN